VIDYEEDNAGFVVGNGDGTVPLLSLGYMCQGGWRGRTALNPANARVLTLEFPAEQLESDAAESEPRYSQTADVMNLFRGSQSSDHVDIMGNENLIADILHLASGTVDNVRDRIHSDIEAISAKVDQHLNKHTPKNQ
jgi:phospholipid:diacylglycerol acyltransferase